MNYKVLFKKRSIDPEQYDVGVYSSYLVASVVAKGEYYYRGGMTGEYDIIETSDEAQRFPEHLYPTLIQVVGFLTNEEQEVFKESHLKYLKRKGLI